MSDTDSIPVLIPDMPFASQLMPWLTRIDAARCYTNFGPLLGEFETALSLQWPGAQVVGVSSGTVALEIAIAALGLPAASNVLVPAFTFAATASSAMRNGLQPVLADVSPDTWQLTPDIARRAAQQRKLALVIPVAALGCPVDVQAWDVFVADTGIPVVIDAAAAFGNQQLGQRANVVLSFHATKPFGIGEGGALVTRDGELAARVRSLSNFGFHSTQVRELGSNAKLSEYAAAVGLAQWERWPGQQARRQMLWQTYAQALRAVPSVQLQQGFAHNELPATLSIGLPVAAADVAAKLAWLGIQSRRWYCATLQHHPLFTQCPKAEELSVSSYLNEYSLGLPWYTAITPAQCERVVRALQYVLGDHDLT